METTNIYTLTDPITGKVRYVGKANNVSQRYKAHLNRARKHQIHKKNWIESLKKVGLKPIIDVVDEVPIHDWIFWEIYWISQFRTWGFDLINYTEGGDGCTFGNQTSFKNGQGGKKIVGFNNLGIKIYEFDVAEEATRKLKTHRSVIPSCANGRTKTVKGLAWFYETDIIHLNDLELLSKINDRFFKDLKQNSGSFKKGCPSLKKRKVGMYSLDGMLIKTFDSLGSAATYIGVTNGAIQFACTKSKKNICKNYKWLYDKN